MASIMPPPRAAMCPCRPAYRGLVEATTIIPENGTLRIEVRGVLAAMLALPSAPNTKGAGISAGAFSEQIKMVAGKRNHRQLTPIMVTC